MAAHSNHEAEDKWWWGEPEEEAELAGSRLVWKFYQAGWGKWENSAAILSSFIQASGNVGATGKYPPAFSPHILEVQLLRKANVTQVLNLHGKEKRVCYLIIYWCTTALKEQLCWIHSAPSSKCIKHIKQRCRLKAWDAFHTFKLPLPPLPPPTHPPPPAAAASAERAMMLQKRARLHLCHRCILPVSRTATTTHLSEAAQILSVQK